MANYTFSGVSNGNVDYNLTLSGEVVFQDEIVGLILDFLALNAMELTAYKRYEVAENITPVI